MNYTEEDIPYTRIIEHKHFDYVDSNNTYVTFEYPIEYKADKTEPMYPVNDEENNKKYLQYKTLADKENNIIFGGRLAEYKYYDMHQIIDSALNFIKTI
jgi:UDP-galactopyranose mutase